jgi:hypothetical protein
MTQCGSRVTTRLRYVLKLVETSGSPIEKTRTVQVCTISLSQSQYVSSVSTVQNAPNGASNMRSTESGEDYPLLTGDVYVRN